MDSEKYQELFKRQEKIADEFIEVCNEFFKKIDAIKNSDEYKSIDNDITEYNRMTKNDFVCESDKRIFDNLELFKMNRILYHSVDIDSNDYIIIISKLRDIKNSITKNRKGIDTEFKPLTHINVPKKHVLAKMIREHKKEFKERLTKNGTFLGDMVMKNIYLCKNIDTEDNRRSSNYINGIDRLYKALPEMIATCMRNGHYRIQIQVGAGYSDEDVLYKKSKPLVIWENDDENVKHEYEFNKL